MKPKRTASSVALAVSLVAALLLSGCGGAMRYTKAEAIDAARMAPLAKEKIDILVPPGYEVKELPEGAYRQDTTMAKWLGSNPTVAFLQKTGTPDHIIVFCWSGLSFVANTSLPEIARHLTESSMPDGQMAAGTYEMGSGFFKKYFEAYRGNVAVKGQNLPAVNWLAWRGTPGLDCKYVLYGTTFGGVNPAFEDEFVSVVRNMK